MPESTENKQALTQWKPGQSGNPKGRPKGSRHKINEAFLRDFQEAWEALGRPALLAMAWQHPDKFVQCAASLLPKESKLEVAVTDLTDEQLRSRIHELANELKLDAGAGLASGGGGPAEGQGEVRH